MRLRAEQAANEQVAPQHRQRAEHARRGGHRLHLDGLPCSAGPAGWWSGQNETNGPDDRAAMASEIDQLKEVLLSLANTTYLGRPIFAGTQNVPAAFDTTTGRTWGTERPCSAACPPRTLGHDGRDRAGPERLLHAVQRREAGAGILDRISAALRDPAGPAALDTELGNLDAAAATMQRPAASSARATTACSASRVPGEIRLDAVTADLSDRREHRPGQDDHRHADPAHRLPGGARRGRQDPPAVPARLPALTPARPAPARTRVLPCRRSACCAPAWARPAQPLRLGAAPSLPCGPARGLGENVRSARQVDRRRRR